MAKRHEKYIMVRLLRADHDRLVAFRNRLAAWAAENPTVVPPYLLEEGFGLGVAVRELLRRQDEKNARSRASHQRRLKSRV